MDVPTLGRESGPCGRASSALSAYRVDHECSDRSVLIFQNNPYQDYDHKLLEASSDRKLPFQSPPLPIVSITPSLEPHPRGATLKIRHVIHHDHTLPLRDTLRAARRHPFNTFLFYGQYLFCERRSSPAIPETFAPRTVAEQGNGFSSYCGMSTLARYIIQHGNNFHIDAKSGSVCFV